MRHQYKRAARLRQAILRRVADYQRDWWYGQDPRASKLFSEIDDLIVELIKENSSSDE